MSLQVTRFSRFCSNFCPSQESRQYYSHWSSNLHRFTDYNVLAFDCSGHWCPGECQEGFSRETFLKFGPLSAKKLRTGGHLCHCKYFICGLGLVDCVRSIPHSDQKQHGRNWLFVKWELMSNLDRVSFQFWIMTTYYAAQFGIALSVAELQSNKTQFNSSQPQSGSSKKIK